MVGPGRRGRSWLASGGFGDQLRSYAGMPSLSWTVTAALARPSASDIRPYVLETAALPATCACRRKTA